MSGYLFVSSISFDNKTLSKMKKCKYLITNNTQSREVIKIKKWIAHSNKNICKKHTPKHHKFSQ